MLDLRKNQYTEEFKRCAFTLEQVRECLESAGPDGMTWLEYCQRNNYTIEDTLMPLLYQHKREPINCRNLDLI